MASWTRKSRILLLIIASAILLRLIIAFYLGNSTPLETDETSYSILANRLVNGFGFSFPKNWYPSFVAADAPTAHWSFLYTALIAVVYAVFGFNPLAVRLFSAVLGGVLLPWMMYRLARRVWPKRENIALLSAGLGAVYAYFILFSAQLMTETFFISAVLWSLERSLALITDLKKGETDLRHNLITAVGLGVSLGLATLFRQSILPWAVVSFALLLWVGWKSSHLQSAFLSLLLSGLILIAFILPFTIRNYRVFGEFMLLNSNAGFAMYSAQHPMHGTSFQAFTAAPLPDDIYPLPENEPQWDRALMSRGFQFIAADPGRYALLSISRLADYFMFWPARQTSLINNVGRLLSSALFLPLMIYGLWISARHWRTYWFLYIFMLFYSIMHLLTWAMIRYRLPVDAVLLLFAALGLAALSQRFRLSRTKSPS